MYQSCLRLRKTRIADWDQARTDLVLDYREDIGQDEDSLVLVEGSLAVTYTGFTSPGCLSLAPTGLIIPLSGPSCGQARGYLCHHRSCFTREGMECVFPFTFRGETHSRCISQSVYQPWCATEISSERILSWGLCLADCPHHPPPPSCLQPPPVPPLQLSLQASWFNLSAIRGEDKFLVTRDSRKKVYQPWMEYNRSHLYEEDLSVIVSDQFDSLAGVYEVVAEGGLAEYSCPPGLVFEGTNTRTQTAVCQGWRWRALFNTSAACVPVLCPEHQLPTFPSSNLEEVKEDDPRSWNSWRGEVRYTCPGGYVMDHVGGGKSFTVICGDSALWTALPRCIPINCTEPPFPVRNNDVGSYNWTGQEGEQPRPFATQIRYFCPREGWGYPSTGDREQLITCQMDGSWSNLKVIEDCEKLPCPSPPPAAPPGPGAERIYNPQISRYKCRNGHQFSSGHFPFFPVECHNRGWAPVRLPECVPRKCSERRPQEYSGQTVLWRRDRKGYRRRDLGESILYLCPESRVTVSGLAVQEVRCIWHRQTDTMLWWPQGLEPCNSKISRRT